MNEFAHGCADDDHWRLAGRMEPRAHRANRGIPAQGGDRRKIQGLAQAAGPDLRQATTAAERAGLDDARHEAGEGGGLARAGVRLVEEFGDEHGGGGLADARNSGEQLALRPQPRMSIEMIANELLDMRDLRVELGHDDVNRRADLGDRDAGGETIQLLRAHAVQGVEAAHQRLQRANLRRRGRPRGSRSRR